jgi:PTS system nitrogen regulatory IIA component
VRLSELLPSNQIRVGLEVVSKREAIEALIDMLPLNGNGCREQVLEAVLERESKLSTGIGRGVAVPHGKCDAVEGLMAAMATHEDGLPFDSVDGEPCRILFLLVSNTGASGPHIRALAQVARVLNQEKAKKALQAAQTPEEVVKVFRDDEAREGL